MKALIFHDESHFFSVLTQIFFSEEYQKKIIEAVKEGEDECKKLFSQDMILFDVTAPLHIESEKIREIKNIEVKSPMVFAACEK